MGIIEEELELALGKGNILSILRNDVSAVIDECKLIGSKAVIKGDLVINALYCTTEGNAEVYENKIDTSENEKENAQIALNECLTEIREGKYFPINKNVEDYIKKLDTAPSLIQSLI